MLSVIQATGEPALYRERILVALAGVREHWDAVQRFHLARLFAVAGDTRARAARAALAALRHVTDGRVRALAMTILEGGTATGGRKGEALHLIARTFSAGDAARIAALLDAWRDADADDLHGLGYGALAALGAHPVPEAAPALLTLYGYSPCSHCRERYVDLLQQMGQLSEWGTKRNSL